MKLTLLVALLTTITRPVPPPAPVTYSGRDGQLHVRVPRLELDAVIDGNLDEPAWSQAARLTGFSQFSPQDGIPATDSTEVLVWYSPTAIYFGIRAYEAHGQVHATHADRDKIATDDNVQIFLGTFHDRRQAIVFGVNPFGVQMDGTMAELGQSLAASWSGALAARAAPDLNQDFVFESKGRLTDYGYEVEIRIPFKSLKYQADDEQQWDFNVVRDVQHSGSEDSWAPAKRANPSFLGQAGSLDGLHGIAHDLVLDVNPVVTQKSVGTPGAAGWAYNRGTPQFGASARWGVTNNLTLSGTAHPDFAEVESDAGKLIIDPRNALFFPEKRPFFLDGADQFNVPGNLIYTRRVVQPQAAVKLSGKAVGTTIGLLSAVDDPSSTTTGQSAVYNILRLQRDIGGQSRLGAAYTDRVSGSDYNRLADVDSRLVFGGLYSATLQYAGSLTHQGTRDLDGSLWSTVLARTGKNYGFRYTFNGTTDDFRAQSGFISRTGITHAAVDNHWTWFGERGTLVDNVNLALVWDDTWQTANFERHGDAQDKKYHVSLSSTLRGGWSIGTAMYWETFGFDDQLYAGYRMERTIGAVVDTVPFTGTPRIMNRDYVFTLNTPKFSTFSGTLLYVGGQDENFFEWAQADIKLVSASLSLRPTARIRIDGTYDYQEYRRRTDHTVVGRSLIPRVKVEYQVTRSMFVRVVGELDGSERDDLRDETRTGFPLIINGKKALASRSRTFFGDLLFSYQPMPGTVLFVGYGGQADGFADPLHRFAYQSLVRDTDLSRSGRSEKGVGIAGGRLGELFHRDVAGARVDPQLGAGDAALEPVRVRQRDPSIQLAPLDEDRQLQLAQPIRQRRIGRTRDPRQHRAAVAGAPRHRPVAIDDRVGEPRRIAVDRLEVAADDEARRDMEQSARGPGWASAPAGTALAAASARSRRRRRGSACGPAPGAQARTSARCARPSSCRRYRCARRRADRAAPRRRGHIARRGSRRRVPARSARTRAGRSGSAAACRRAAAPSHPRCTATTQTHAAAPAAVPPPRRDSGSASPRSRRTSTAALHTPAAAPRAECRAAPSPRSRSPPPATATRPRSPPHAARAAPATAGAEEKPANPARKP